MSNFLNCNCFPFAYELIAFMISLHLLGLPFTEIIFRLSIHYIRLAASDVFIASVLDYIHINPQDNLQIISNDLGVQLKCKAHKLKFLIPNEKYLISEEDAAEKEIKKLTFELNRVKNLQPKLRLQFDNGETHKAFDIKEPWKECEEDTRKIRSNKSQKSSS